MKRRALELYQYLGPAILTPLAAALWWFRYDGNLWLTAYACGLPILYAYIVPGVGTNVLKVWEFDTRFSLGRFRPQHGFVFGSATSMIVWVCHGQPVAGYGDLLRLALVLAGVLGSVNTLYDIHALRAGLLRVYNQPWADGRGPEAIALDYCPWFFGGFGAAFGLALGAAEWLSLPGGMDGHGAAWLFPAGLALTIAVPVLGYRAQSFRRHGHSGCRPVPARGGGGSRAEDSAVARQGEGGKVTNDLEME